MRILLSFLLLFLSYISFSQESKQVGNRMSLNLGFHHYDYTTLLPRSWVIVNSDRLNYHVHVDTAKDYSLHLDGSAIGASESIRTGLLVTKRIPLPYPPGRKLTLTTKVLSKDISTPDIELITWLLDIHGNTIKKVVGKAQGTGGQWQEINLNVFIPASCRYIVPGILLKSAKEYWVQGLSLHIDGLKIEDAINREKQATIKDITLQSSQHAPLGKYNLDNELPKQAVQSQVVGIGEYCHGSKENLVQFVDICKLLFTQSGFNAVALETDVDVCRKIDHYINGGEEDINSLFEAVGWHLNNAVITDFIVWLRTYNKASEKKIHLYGMDMQAPFYAMEELADALAADTNAADLVRRIETYGAGIRSGQPSSASVVTSLTTAFRDTFISPGYGKTTPDNRINIELIYQFLTNECRKEQASFDNERLLGIGSFRDSCMAQNVLGILSGHKDMKMVILAHNGHIGKETGLLGGYLKAQLHDKYFAAGAIIGSGTYFSYWDYRNQQSIDASIPAAPEGAMEKLLDDAYPSSSWISLNTYPKHTTPVLFNFLGVAQSEAMNFSWRVQPIQLFDGLIFLKHSTPADVSKKPM